MSWLLKIEAQDAPAVPKAASPAYLSRMVRAPTSKDIEAELAKYQKRLEQDPNKSKEEIIAQMGDKRIELGLRSKAGNIGMPICFALELGPLLAQIVREYYKTLEDIENILAQMPKIQSATAKHHDALVAIFEFGISEILSANLEIGKQLRESEQEVYFNLKTTVNNVDKFLGQLKVTWYGMAKVIRPAIGQTKYQMADNLFRIATSAADKSTEILKAETNIERKNALAATIREKLDFILQHFEEASRFTVRIMKPSEIQKGGTEVPVKMSPAVQKFMDEWWQQQEFKEQRGKKTEANIQIKAEQEEALKTIYAEIADAIAQVNVLLEEVIGINQNLQEEFLPAMNELADEVRQIEAEILPAIMEEARGQEGAEVPFGMPALVPAASTKDLTAQKEPTQGGRK